MKIEIKNQEKLVQGQIELIKTIIHITCDDLKKSNEILTTSFVMNSKTKSITVIVHSFDNNIEKDMNKAMIIKTVKKENADSVLFVAESWMLKDKNTNSEKTSELYQEYQEGLKSGKYENMGDHPNSIDVVMFQYECVKGMWTGMAIIKTISKKNRFIDSVELFQGERVSGRFTHLIPLRAV